MYGTLTLRFFSVSVFQICEPSVARNAFTTDQSSPAATICSSCARPLSLEKFFSHTGWPEFASKQPMRPWNVTAQVCAPTSPGAPVTSNPFLSDTDLAYIPKVSGVASYSHTWPSVLGGALTAQLATQFQSSALQARAQDPVYGVVAVRSAGWGMGDASLKYQSNSSKWSVEVYVHNFTNRLAATNEGYSTTTHAITESFYPPRIVGGIISAKF